MPEQTKFFPEAVPEDGKRPFQTAGPDDPVCRFCRSGVADNNHRHPAVQHFMLHNDTVTIAAGVPMFLDQSEVRAFREEGFDAGGLTASITTSPSR